jgi:DNA-binding NarL/FixJ family response regulator
MKIHVLVIDSDEEFCVRLASPLGDNNLITVEGYAHTAEEARKHIAKHKCDVYLVSLQLPDGNGLEIVRHITENHRHAKVIVLSALGGEDHILSSITAGASSFVLKSEQAENIIRIIIATVNEGAHLNGQASRILIHQVREWMASSVKAPPNNGGRLPMFTDCTAPQTDHCSAKLTNKELQVLRHIATGLASKQVALAMNISIFTVNQHLRNIYQKLRAKNKMQAVQRAIQMGIL